MKIVEPFVKRIDIKEPYKKIEYAGRICYKTQDKITDESCDKFVASIASRGHCSVLEHESITLEMTSAIYNKLINIIDSRFFEETASFKTYNHLAYITGNIRAWKEHLDKNYDKALYDLLGSEYDILFPAKGDRGNTKVVKIVDFNNLSLDDIEREYMPACDAKKHISYTYHIRTDRATSHQIVRHRLSSFSQESQRYCNYSTDKFGNEIKFILPVDVIDMENEMEDVKTIREALLFCERTYFYLLDQGIKPEAARCVLPNATATEIVMTSNLLQWDRFFSLRCDSHAQIDIRKIADTIKNDIYGE